MRSPSYRDVLVGQHHFDGLVADRAYLALGVKCNAAEIESLLHGCVGAVRSQRAAQQLVGEPSKPDAAAIDAPVQAVELGRVGFIEGELGLRPECGYRRSDLMGGVRDEIFHLVDAPFQSAHEAVDSVDEHSDLGGRGHRDGREVVGIAGKDRLLDAGQTDAARGEPPASVSSSRARPAPAMVSTACVLIRAASWRRSCLVWATITST